MDKLIAAPIQLRAQLRELRRVERENSDHDVALMIAEQRKDVMAQLDKVWIDVCKYDVATPGFARHYTDIMILLMGNDNEEERSGD
jgi:hypothetical protein